MNQGLNRQHAVYGFRPPRHLSRNTPLPLPVELDAALVGVRAEATGAGRPGAVALTSASQRAAATGAGKTGSVSIDWTLDVARAAASGAGRPGVVDLTTVEVSAVLLGGGYYYFGPYRRLPPPLVSWPPEQLEQQQLRALRISGGGRVRFRGRVSGRSEGISLDELREVLVLLQA